MESTRSALLSDSVRYLEYFGMNTLNTPQHNQHTIAANCGRIAAELRQNGYTTQRYRETHRARCQETSDEKVTEEAGSNGLDFVDLC